MKAFKNLKSLRYLAMVFSLAFICFATTACQDKNATENYNGYYFFASDSKASKLNYIKFSPKSKNTDDLINEFLEKMREVPNNTSTIQVLPSDVVVESHTIDSDGNLTLYFNSAYSNTTGIQEILMRASIVKNLVQIPDINSVQFYVSGQPLTDKSKNPIGLMSADDFIDNTNGEITYTQTVSLTLYFSDSTGNSLKRVPVEINYDATMSVEETIMKQLIQGPRNISGVKDNEVLPTIPDDTVVNKITVKDKICYIDLSDEFLDKPDDISSYVAIYSVVNTLTELSTIDKVQFSIDGKQTLLYNESINFGDLFERNLDIVAGA